MLECISHYLVDRTIKNGIISKDDEELYLFAFQSLLWHLASWLTLLLLGLTFGCFLESVVYMVLLTPLRIYSGGFHQSSYLSCYISSLLLFSGTVLFCKFANKFVTTSAVTVCLVICAAVIFAVVPLADKNKPLDADETIKYRKKARSILLIEIAVFVLLVVCHTNVRLLLFTAAAPATVALLLIMSIVQTQFPNNKNR